MKVSIASACLLSCISAFHYSQERVFNLNASQQQVRKVETSLMDLRTEEGFQWTRSILINGQVHEMSVEQVDALTALNMEFEDVTGEENRIQPEIKEYRLPERPVLQSIVKPAIAQLSAENIKQNILKFSEFQNRYYRSEHGVRSAQWLYETIEELTRKAAPHLRFSMKKVAHNWSQFSIITRLESASTDLSLPVTIISAHQDSTATASPMNARAPGADDDASGTMSVLEVFRVLTSMSNYNPKNPVEFHWYSAEEAGLLGSKDVAAEYKKRQVQVNAVCHLDLTGYNGKESVVGIVTDFTSPAVSQLMRVLTKEYLSIPAIDTKCNYACSDHASWTKNGYPAAFPTEAQFKNASPYLHSARDVMANISELHCLEFSKLALSFALEVTHKQ